LAQSQNLATEEHLISLEIDGLILNETKTKAGTEFYDFFYTKWVAPLEAFDFIISIEELPGRGRGSQVSIKVNDHLVFRRGLQPRSDLIEEVANIAVQIVQRHLVQRQKISSQLGEGDMTGSGIF
jgi:curli production assembly/transport component CsgE